MLLAARGRRAGDRSDWRRRTRQWRSCRRPRLLDHSPRLRSATRLISACQAAGVMKKLMKPGPAISVFATRSFEGSASTIFAASARGFVRAALARRIATPVAKSPCATSRLRSIAGSGKGPSPSVPAGSAASAPFTSFSMRFFKRAILYQSTSVNFRRVDVQRPAQRARNAELHQLVDPVGQEGLQ